MSEIIQESLCKNETEQKIYNVCMDLAVFLIDKNRRYGNSAIKPVRILAKSDPKEQILVRADDKINRMMALDASDIDKYKAWKDLSGYWVLWEVKRSE